MPLALLLGLLLAAAGAEGAEGALDYSDNQIALKVNAQVVSVREVEGLFADSLLLLEDRLRRGELKPEARAGAVRAAWTAALQTAIQDALLDQLGAARREEIIRWVLARANPSTLEARVLDRFHRLESDETRRLRAELIAAAGGEKELRAALKRKGQTLADWESTLPHELFRRYVLYESLGFVIVSPAAARAWYDAHPEQFRQPDAWRLRRIRVPKAKFASPEAAAEAARMIRAKLAEGADFGALAERLQYDPESDARGGVLVVEGKTGLPSGNFPAEELIARGLKDGETSAPVDAGDALLLVRREEYRPGAALAFEDAVERATALALADTLTRKKAQFFEKQKREAFVEILVAEPPARWLKP